MHSGPGHVAVIAENSKYLLAHLFLCYDHIRGLAGLRMLALNSAGTKAWVLGREWLANLAGTLGLSSLAWLFWDVGHGVCLSREFAVFISGIDFYLSNKYELFSNLFCKNSLKIYICGIVSKYNV